ncbi:MAG: NAD(P)H-binding protein [Myxococcales bacterium]|nr:NAD(P)H-binding protein [Myxococcales bacterium]
MKILVLGASKGTGALCVKSALAKGHSVTAFARSPAKLELEHPKLEKVAGNFHDAASVRAAVVGHDAVIICVSVAALSDFKAKPDYFSAGTAFCIDAMKAHGVKRLVILSAQGAGDSVVTANWFLKTFVIGGILKLAFRDHDVQERLTRESGLEFVIARPTRLTDGPGKGQFTKTAELVKVPSAISRADVADFLVDSCTSTAFLGKAVQLGG